MKTINNPNEPLRQIFQDVEDFQKNIDFAFDYAEKGDTVEIWANGDYFTLDFHSLLADEAGDAAA